MSTITVSDIFSLCSTRKTKIKSVGSNSFETEELKSQRKPNEKYAIASIDVDIAKLNAKIGYGTLNSIKLNYTTECNVNKGGWDRPTTTVSYINSSGGESQLCTHSKDFGAENNPQSFGDTFSASCKANDGTYHFILRIDNEQALTVVTWAKVTNISLTLDYTPHTCKYTIETARTPATCTSTGSVTHKCSVTGCTKTQTSTLAKDPNNHTGSQQILSAVAATCTTAGKTEGKKWSCCNAIITAQQTVPALGHDWNYTTYRLSDDGKTVTAQRVCKTDANHKETETVPTTSKRHTEPTCTENGITAYAFTFSSSWAYSHTLYVPNIPAKGHTWVNATCTSPKKCSVCGTTEGNALPHSYTSTVIPPTASADGYTSHTCSGCGHNYKDNYRINKIFFGTTQPSKIFFGTQEVKEVYYGTTKVYGPK